MSWNKWLCTKHGTYVKDGEDCCQCDEAALRARVLDEALEALRVLSLEVPGSILDGVNRAQSAIARLRRDNKVGG